MSPGGTEGDAKEIYRCQYPTRMEGCLAVDCGRGGDLQLRIYSKRGILIHCLHHD